MISSCGTITKYCTTIYIFFSFLGYRLKIDYKPILLRTSAVLCKIWRQMLSMLYILWHFKASVFSETKQNFSQNDHISIKIIFAALIRILRFSQIVQSCVVMWWAGFRGKNSKLNIIYNMTLFKVSHKIYGLQIKWSQSCKIWNNTPEYLYII